MLNLARAVACLATAMVMLVSTAAMAADDKAALGDLQELKVGFDLKEGDGKLLLNRLEIIDETRQSLIGQGVKPHFILAFRGTGDQVGTNRCRADQAPGSRDRSEDCCEDQADERFVRRRGFRAMRRGGAGTGDQC